MQSFQGRVGGGAERGGSAEEPQPGAVHVDLQGDHRSGAGDRGTGPAEVPGDLRGQLAVPPVMGAVGTVAHLPQQMAAPLRARLPIRPASPSG